MKISKKKILDFQGIIFLKIDYTATKFFKINFNINTFLKKKRLTVYNGRMFTYIHLKNIYIKHKFRQFLFSKKPFSGPVKKFKK